MNVREALDSWFQEPGAYVLVDGQYGSTGKGLIAAVLAENFWQRVQCVVSNAGPNSGHTSYYGPKRIVLKQLPTFSVMARYLSCGLDHIHTHLSAGAVINRGVLMQEIREHDIVNFSVHPAAAVIDEKTLEADFINVRRIASTGQGVGPALERKLHRFPAAVWGQMEFPFHNNFKDATCFFEVPQGFSLGINSGFYPYVTTRECTVSQALADAGLPPSFHRRTIMAVRTYPIRVGDTESTSGPCYSDQKELTWGALGVVPEMTTVTGRIRRVFTWSIHQFCDALEVNAPDVIFLNFCNYLPTYELQKKFIVNNVYKPYFWTMGHEPEAILLGFGPRCQDVSVWEG